MATKPTLADARWATDLTNNTAPSSGQRDTGWTPNQVAVSDYFNVLANEAYKWFQWLDDGDLTVGDLTVDNLHVLNDVDIDDDLNVDGDFTLDGDFHHGSRIMLMPLSFGTLAYSSGSVAKGTLGDNTYTFIDTGATAVWKVAPLSVGDRVTTIRVYGTPISPGVNPTIEIWRATANSTGASMAYTPIGGSTIGIGGYLDMSLDSPFTLAIDESIHILVLGGGSGGDNMYQAAITWERP